MRNQIIVDESKSIFDQPLSVQLFAWRTNRPDEWSMDEFADKAADQEAELKALANSTLGRIATLELALSEISALTMDRLDEAGYIAVEALCKDKG